MFRLYFRTFAGECRAPLRIRGHIREPSRWILVPLVVLAFLSIIGGVVGLPDAYGEVLFGIPESNSLRYFLEEVAKSAHHEASRAHEFTLAGVTTLAAAAGAGLAALLYVFRTDLVPALTRALRPLYTLVFNKYWVDEIYHAAVVGPLVRVSDRFLFRVVDAGLIDGAGVNGVAAVVRGIGDRGLKFAQTGLAQSYVLVMLIGGVLLAAYLMGGS